MILPERPVPDLRGEDRRQGPRRAEDAHAHYAREVLLAAALDVADHPGQAVPPHLLASLRHAATAYESAERTAHPEWAS